MDAVLDELDRLASDLAEIGITLIDPAEEANANLFGSDILELVEGWGIPLAAGQGKQRLLPEGLRSIGVFWTLRN